MSEVIDDSGSLERNKVKTLNLETKELQGGEGDAWE